MFWLNVNEHVVFQLTADFFCIRSFPNLTKHLCFKKFNNSVARYVNFLIMLIVSFKMYFTVANELHLIISRKPGCKDKQWN